ncbi:RNA-binding protein [Cenarchaeum symbiosum A]|uniref:RNA-binding protein n=1 Tax=Cenarchaeum symbiosum (strain A) TaxID=414004 RepID=A0RYW2_CENSY|nr:RNA-binding protein [Cenarchaeum symbiosum A]
MKIAGIELRYLVDDIAKRTGGYYVSNIYGISPESLLFKLHHPEKEDIMLMLSTFGLWTSSVRIEQVGPNRLLARLRKELLRSRLESVEQPGMDRIAYLRFEGPRGTRILAGEFFGGGNMILCGDGMMILALLHQLEVRHRRLRPGLKYEPPPSNSLDVLGLTRGDLEEGRPEGLSADRWLGRTLGLPARYVEHILRGAGVNPKSKCSTLSAGELDAVALSTGETAGKVARGEHSPVTVGDEVYPIDLGMDGAEAVPSFVEGLDMVFTRIILDSGRKARSGEADKKIAEVQARMDEQERAVRTVTEKAGAISGLARSLQGLAAASLGDAALDDVLKAHSAEYSLLKGVPTLSIHGEKISVDPRSSIHSAASSLFDEAKRQSGAVPAIEKLRAKAAKELDALRRDSEEQAASVSFTKVRRKSWYERYRWFFTTDGSLAVGGRDSSSNTSIIRRHLDANDRVFHADTFGSPFFILKDGADSRPAGLEEAAHATVCFSRAWREAMYGLSAYWVLPEQVKKAAPSGQFLPKGSFVIEGRRNFVKIPTLRLAVGLVQDKAGVTLTCGPPEAVKGRCTAYAVIEPGGSEMTDAAKKIRLGFMAVNEQLAGRVSMDDYVRALPAGKSHVVETGEGGAQE